MRGRVTSGVLWGGLPCQGGTSCPTCNLDVRAALGQPSALFRSGGNIAGRSRRTFRGRKGHCAPVVRKSVEGRLQLLCVQEKQLDGWWPHRCADENDAKRSSWHRGNSLSAGHGDLQQLWLHPLFQRGLNGLGREQNGGRGKSKGRKRRGRWRGLVRPPLARDSKQSKVSKPESSSRDRMRLSGTKFQMKSFKRSPI